MEMKNFLEKHKWEILWALVFALFATFIVEGFIRIVTAINLDIGNSLKKYRLLIIGGSILILLTDFIFKGPIVKSIISVLLNLLNLTPAQKFEQKYREWLINRFKFLNVRGIKTNAPVAIELERVFISLRTKKSPEKMRVSGKESKTKKDTDKTPSLEKFNKNEFIKKMEEYSREKIYELKDLFNLPWKRFIIIGVPGSGKTTLLNYLALKFTRKVEKKLFEIENELLPIFINLRDTLKKGFLDIKKFAENYVNYIDLSNCPKDFFEKRLADGKCIILLDGLDEVAKEEERVRVAKWVDDLSTTYSKNIFIATSRPYGYDTAHLYNDFLELHILDFTPEQVDQFIKNWTKAIEIKVREDESEFTLKEAEQEADRLLQAIRESPKIEVLTVNPLLLTIVSLVHRYRGALPKRRVELYEECCDVILGYWDIAKGIVGKLEPRKKRAILQPLAFYLHQNGLREETRERFIELLENELPKIDVPKYKVNELLEDVRDRCGILVETKLGFFGFSHLTFQEFLTARHILDNKLEDFLIARKKDKYWLEVALLYCGMKDDSTEFLKKILQEKDDILHTNLFLAGTYLAESLKVSPELRIEITQRLSDIYSDKNEYPESRKRALEILKEVKDPQIVQKLIEKTKDKETDVRREAAFALGEIQAKEAISHLIELSKDKESDVREQAASALGEIQAKEAIPYLIELLRDKESVVRWRAARALGKIQAKEAILPLIELLKDKVDYVIAGAAHALGEIQAKDAVHPLMELLKHKESFVRWRAAEALGRIRSTYAVLHLIELLKDRESDVRAYAASALGEIKAKEAIPYLIELLKDKIRDVRESAALALSKIGYKK